MSGLFLLRELQLRHVFCGILFFSVCPLPVMLPSGIPKLPINPLVRAFPDAWNVSSFTTPSPGWVFIPNSLVSLFVFYILSYLLSKRMGCLSGCLLSSASIQKLFCGSCSTFKWFFWWICVGESSFPILFLHHLRTTCLCFLTCCLVWSQIFFQGASIFQFHGCSRHLQPPKIKSTTVSAVSHLLAMKWWDWMPWS